MLLVVCVCVCVCVCCPSLWVWWNPQGRACSQFRLNTPDSAEAHKVSEVHPKTCIGEQTLPDLASASNHRAPRHESLSFTPSSFLIHLHSPSLTSHPTLNSPAPLYLIHPVPLTRCAAQSHSLCLCTLSHWTEWTARMIGMWRLYGSCFLSLLLFFFWSLLEDFLPNNKHMIIVYIWRRYDVHLFIFYLDWLKCLLIKCKQQETTGKNNSPKTNEKSWIKSIANRQTK